MKVKIHSFGSKIVHILTMSEGCYYLSNWKYEIFNKQYFFISVLKYGIVFEEIE